MWDELPDGCHQAVYTQESGMKWYNGYGTVVTCSVSYSDGDLLLDIYCFTMTVTCSVSYSDDSIVKSVTCSVSYSDDRQLVD